MEKLSVFKANSQKMKSKILFTRKLIIISYISYCCDKTDSYLTLSFTFKLIEFIDVVQEKKRKLKPHFQIKARSPSPNCKFD